MLACIFSIAPGTKDFSIHELSQFSNRISRRWSISFFTPLMSVNCPQRFTSRFWGGPSISTKNSSTKASLSVLMMMPSSNSVRRSKRPSSPKLVILLEAEAVQTRELFFCKAQSVFPFVNRLISDVSYLVLLIERKSATL